MQAPECGFLTRVGDETIQCPAPGVHLRRTATEIKAKGKSNDGVSIRTDQEEFFCGIHFKPGTITQIDGTKVQYPSMHWYEAERYHEPTKA